MEKVGTSMRIDVRDLSWSSGLSPILHGISCPLGPAALVGILGPSGAGKSTFLKLVNGCRRDGDGSVRYGGRELKAHWDELRSLVGYVPQDDVVHVELSPREELLFAARLRMPDEEEGRRARRVEAVLAMLDLAHVATSSIGRLSGGQRKRVSLGVELLTEPPLLFLDEPTSGLDPALEARMMEIFRRLAAQGRTVLVTTHVMESLHLLDRVLLLVRGRQAYFGPPESCLTHFGVTSFPAVYDVLATRPPAEWQRLFRESPAWRAHVQDPLAAPPAPTEPRPPAAADAFTAPVAPAPSAPTPPPAAEVDDELAALKRELGR